MVSACSRLIAAPRQPWHTSSAWGAARELLHIRPGDPGHGDGVAMMPRALIYSVVVIATAISLVATMMLWNLYDFISWISP